MWLSTPRKNRRVCIIIFDCVCIIIHHPRIQPFGPSSFAWLRTNRRMTRARLLAPSAVVNYPLPVFLCALFVLHQVHNWIHASVRLFRLVENNSNWKWPQDPRGILPQKQNFVGSWCLNDLGILLDAPLEANVGDCSKDLYWQSWLCNVCKVEHAVVA